MREIIPPECYTPPKKEKDQSFFITPERSIFIAGGITGCAEWQSEFVELLKDTNMVILNPRRGSFDISNVALEQEQITWEHDHIKMASAHSFWFCEETICPIALLELGLCASSDKPLFVGTHPKYSRRRDVRIQMLLWRPEVEVVHTLEGLANQVKEWASTPF